MNRPALSSAPDVPFSPSVGWVRSVRSGPTDRVRRLRLGRVGVVGVVGILTAVAVAGCSSQSTLQTQVPYQPADGVAASSGVVQARDLLLVAAAKGDPAYLSGSLINTGADTVEVAFASQEAAATNQSAGSVQLGPREQLRIETITIPAVAAAPGSLTAIVMSTPAGQVLVAVPVLAPTAGSPYATLTPTSTPTSTPTPTPATTAATTPPATPAATPATTTTAP